MTSTVSAVVAHYARCSMSSLTGLVPVSACAFYQVDALQQPRHYLLQGMPGGTHQHYLAHYQQHDPLLPVRFGPDTTVMPVSEALPAGRLQQSRYGRFMARHGMHDVVELFIRRGGRVVAGFSLIRDATLGSFTGQEVQTLQHLHGLLELAAGSHLPLADPMLVSEVALTPREQEVALLLRDGASNKTIARLLDMGVPTVKTHLQHLYRKFGVNNRTALTRCLFEQLPDSMAPGLVI
ncbi:LuxR C-terminal-related transcriptional regulator [Vogesella sp. DC21W]|uniref:LuxR C-terminal-related transcriptional regulator n=1 Tax=Vogesella aquatica TaxID=2984206 RepID=A0ABT5IXK8_9NEIS|nr:LuxR C-terminal-related transcriptional regulator [Vogesella aquatica]MDC7717197.1 LuxR C-terminal-related transcriptional regulator [Vogesella aquatica]